MLASWLTGTAATGRSHDLVAAAPFALGLLVASLSGAIYTGPSSRRPRASLGLSTTVIARCGTCLNVGTFLSFLPGLAADAWGPKPVLLGGGAAGGGWGALSLATYAARAAAVPSPPAPASRSSASAWLRMITASLVCNTNNPRRRGPRPAVAALLACFSLSSGFFGAWLAVVFAYDDAASLRFLAFATLVGGTMARSAPRPWTGRRRRRRGRTRRPTRAPASSRSSRPPPSASWRRCRWRSASSARARRRLRRRRARTPRTRRPGAHRGRRRRPARAAEAEAAALAPPVRGRGDEGAGCWARLFHRRGSGLALLDEASAIVDSVEADDDPAATTRLVALFAAATTLSKLAVGAAARPSRRASGSPTTCAFVLAVDAAFMALAVAGLAGAVRLGSSAGATAAAAFVGAGFASWVLARSRRATPGPEHYGAIHGPTRS
ncbi:hypothetical protein JL722_10550 [Aureococcus anophagefferens]|nr:hypothetical protein JL722_10550 [Aureococcus anophagefferens]